MPRAPLTQVEKGQIYAGKLAGKTLAEVAAAVRCSVACARKWWREGRDGGWRRLQQPRRGRGPRGILSRFAPPVAARALACKRDHPRWGPQRVRLALADDPALAGQPLPSPSRLAVFFKAHCPELVRAPRRRRPPVAPQPGREVHQVWQMDSQENVKLQDGEIATIASIRDPVGAAVIASQAYGTKTARRWRKLTLVELRQLFRTAFTEWGTLPDVVVTDNESGQVGNPADPLFPSLFTLWLVGLGIQHQPIRPHRPTDQAHIERQHRTLADFTCAVADGQSVATLQQALDRERHVYNASFPVRANDCQGRPPLLVHPALLQPRRPYHPALETTLFSPQRVAEYVAARPLSRKVSAAGQVRVGRARYSVGRHHAGLAVRVQLEPQAMVWVFSLEATGLEIARRPATGLDVATITGLDPAAVEPLDTPFQLAFAFFPTPEGVRLLQDT